MKRTDVDLRYATPPGAVTPQSPFVQLRLDNMMISVVSGSMLSARVCGPGAALTPSEAM